MTRSLSGDVLHNLMPDYDIADIAHVADNEQMQQVVTQTNLRVPKLCNSRELETYGCVSVTMDPLTLAVGAAEPHTTFKLPRRLFFGAGRDGEELEVSGTIEGVHVFGVPFLGYIETREDRRGEGVASSILPILNLIAESVYGSALTSGPADYINDNGNGLLGRLISDHSLRTNELGFVERSS